MSFRLKTRAGLSALHCSVGLTDWDMDEELKLATTTDQFHHDDKLSDQYVALRPSARASRRKDDFVWYDKTSDSFVKPNLWLLVNPGIACPQREPSAGPQREPSSGPRGEPSSGPRGEPSSGPRGEPSSGPLREPSSGPRREPSSGPRGEPSSGPRGEPSSGPLREPSSGPRREPSSGPRGEPSSGPRGVRDPAEEVQPARLSPPGAQRRLATEALVSGLQGAPDRGQPECTAMNEDVSGRPAKNRRRGRTPISWDNKTLKPGSWPRPPVNYCILIALALKSSLTGSLKVQQIYNFTREHFPFFQTAPDGWKNTIRHNLCFNSSFRKTCNQLYRDGKRKSCFWHLTPDGHRRLQDEVRTLAGESFTQLERSMARPDVIQSLFAL